MTKTRTRAEARILKAIDLLDEVAVLEYASNPNPEVRAARRFLHGRDSIFSAVGTVTNGRRSSDRDLWNALGKLVESGEVVKSTAAGMGGSLTLYRRVET